MWSSSSNSAGTNGALNYLVCEPGLVGETLFIARRARCARRGLRLTPRRVWRLHAGRRCTARHLTNYTKSRTVFRHKVTIEPLVDASCQLLIFKATSSDVYVFNDEPPLDLTSYLVQATPPTSFNFPICRHVAFPVSDAHSALKVALGGHDWAS
jgi:hypothetical protein